MGEKLVVAVGETPLDCMLKVMWDEKADSSCRDNMAKAAAPCAHLKLASLQHSGRNAGPMRAVGLAKLSGDELAQLDIVFGPRARSGDDDAPDQGGEGAKGGSASARRCFSARRPPMRACNSQPTWRVRKRSGSAGSRSTTWIGAQAHCQTQMPGMRENLIRPRVPSTAMWGQDPAMLSRSTPRERRTAARTVIVS